MKKKGKNMTRWINLTAVSLAAVVFVSCVSKDHAVVVPPVPTAKPQGVGVPPSPATSAKSHTIDVTLCPAPPKIDGLLADPCWRNIKPAGQFYNKTDKKDSDDSQVYLCNDDSYLYLAFKNQNETMEEVRQVAFNKDLNVHSDDSVEVFIELGVDGTSYYHFILSHANVKADEKGYDSSWNAPWLSATQRRDDGWDAEIAIPLVVLGGGDAMRKGKICVIRNKREIIIHPMDGPIGENMKQLALGSEQSAHQPATFAPINWKGEVKKIKRPFIPCFKSATVGGYFMRDGKFYYPVLARIAPQMGVSGTALLRITETVGEEAPKSVTQPVQVGKAMDMRVEMPAEDYRSKRVTVSLEDPKTGEVYERQDIKDVSALEAMTTPVVDRNYYTSEQEVKIKCAISLPDDLLKGAELKITAAGEVLCDLKGLAKKTIAAIPLDKFTMGKTELRCELSCDGLALASGSAVVTRLAPKPGYEVKIDKFNRVVLKNGKPFFILGIVAGYLSDGNPEIYGKLKEMGYNTVESDAAAVQAHNRKNSGAIAAMAAKHGLSLLLGCGFHFDPKLSGKTLAERVDIYGEHFHEVWDIAKRGIVEPLAKWDNVVGYYTVDEINLGNSEARIFMADKVYKKMKEDAPYQPIFAVYSRNIPEGRKWTDPMDVLFPDLYTRPGKDRDIAEEMAYWTIKLKQRADQDGKVMVMIPCNGYVNGTLSLSPEMVVCQAYTTVMYGAKGLCSWSLWSMFSKEIRDASQTVNEQMAKLAPALLNQEPEQLVDYGKEAFDPVNRRFPSINTRMFRYPDGSHLLLAVNFKPFQVNGKFSVKGLQSVRRVFGDQSELPVEAGSFSDPFAAYGTAAYRLVLEAEEPLRIAVAAEKFPDKGALAPAPEDEPLFRRLEAARNKVPNPSFERCWINGLPDCCAPFGQCLDMATGERGSSWFLDEEVAHSGKHSIRMRFQESPAPYAQGLEACFVVPPHEQMEKYVVSFHAKAERGAASTLRAKVYYWSDKGDLLNKTFTLSETWQRYSAVIEIPKCDKRKNYSLSLLLSKDGGYVWVDDLQVERGEKPTAFEDSCP